MSNTVDSRIGRGLGDLMPAYVGDLIPIPALTGELGEAGIETLLEGGG